MSALQRQERSLAGGADRVNNELTVEQMIALFLSRFAARFEN